MAHTGHYCKKMLAPVMSPTHLFLMVRPSSRAFTLIELLVVIAIIGILMALLFPAVGSAIDAARRAQAKNDVTQIAAAVLSYESQYGYLPDNTTGKVDQNLINILTGSDTNKNPRKIVFLEVAGFKKGKSGTNGSGSFVDPWALTEGSEKQTVYLIKIDNSSDTTPYDSRLTGVGWGTTESVMKRVAVWNNPQTSTSDSNKQKRRYVKSWD